MKTEGILQEHKIWSKEHSNNSSLPKQDPATARRSRNTAECCLHNWSGLRQHHHHPHCPGRWGGKVLIFPQKTEIEKETRGKIFWHSHQQQKVPDNEAQIHKLRHQAEEKYARRHETSSPTLLIILLTSDHPIPELPIPIGHAMYYGEHYLKYGFFRSRVFEDTVLVPWKWRDWRISRFWKRFQYSPQSCTRWWGHSSAWHWPPSAPGLTAPAKVSRRNGTNERWVACQREKSPPAPAWRRWAGREDTAPEMSQLVTFSKHLDLVKFF